MQNPLDFFKKAPAPVPAPDAVPEPTSAPAVEPTAPATAEAFDISALWAPVEPPKEGEVAQPLNFNFTPEQLAPIVKGIDYSGAIPADLKAQIAAGGEEAVAALMQTVNLVAKDSFQKNLIATGKFIDAAISDSQKRLDAQLEAKIRALSSGDDLGDINPAFTKPEVKPLVDSVKQQILLKYPQASSKQVQQMLGQYFTHLGSTLGSPVVTDPSKTPYQLALDANNADHDWAASLGLPG